MSSKFSETVERPLHMLLNQQIVESGRSVPASRAFDAPRAAHALPHAPAVGFDRILVPTDFSSFSTAAIAYARRLASRLGSEVIVLHVCPSRPRGDFPERTAERHNAAIAEIESQLAITTALPASDARPVRSLVIEGIPHKTIILEALAQKADLIVTAKHGHSGEAQSLFGKTAEFLVRNAHCPVLLIGDEGAVFPARIPHEE
jgi:universal stress protein A